MIIIFYAAICINLHMLNTGDRTRMATAARRIDPAQILTYAEIERMRSADAAKADPLKVIAQRGGQENMLACNADILIGGGQRGGSKTFSLLLEALRDAEQPDFRSVLLRAEIEDLSDMVETSDKIFRQFGEYNKSKNDMRWNFSAGGFLKFSFHAGALDDFRRRFQGKQYAFIGVDEITHMSFQKFKYLLSCNRNAFGLRNRFWGTCNPDPDSWVARFIDWWIGEDGCPLPERDGKVRYCFMDGDDVSTVVWGGSKEEVYEMCRDTVDALWQPGFARYGRPQDLFIKSVAFVEARLADNVKLMSSDPSYLASLAAQSEEQRARDLGGNWRFKSAGTDLIKIPMMERFFDNAQQEGDGTLRVSCDVAFDGGDNFVMWLWRGWHIQDVFACKLDSLATAKAVKAKLEEWHVREENFTYDLNGLGQMFKGMFPHAVPFNNKEAVEDKYRFIYANLKSQAAYMLVQRFTEGSLSIEPALLARRFSGRGYHGMPLRDILLKERKAIRRVEDEEGKGWTLIRKRDMKKTVGHSPDFFEALLMRMVFEIKGKRHRKFKGLGLI